MAQFHQQPQEAMSCAKAAPPFCGKVKMFAVKKVDYISHVSLMYPKKTCMT